MACELYRKSDYTVAYVEYDGRIEIMGAMKY